MCMEGNRDLVILSGADQTKNPEQAFKQFIQFALNGGVYFKPGRGIPRYANPGCKAYVVFKHHIVGILRYAGVDEDFVPGEALGGDEDNYTMDAGRALRFTGPYQEVFPPVPYRKGIRNWEYLPPDLEGKIHVKRTIVGG